MSVVDRVMVYLQVGGSGARIPTQAVARVDPEGAAADLTPEAVAAIAEQVRIRVLR